MKPIRYAKIREMDISNGEGIRVSLFVQGCDFHCKGCFNSDTWNFNGGNEWTKELESKFIEIGNRKYIDGFSILGGEPLAQDKSILELVKRIKSETNKTIWMWTGFKYENLNKLQREVITYIDVLVDGQFIEELKNMRLHFRGSSNQRIIDVKETLVKNEIVLYKIKA